jgi:hypothetical protein
MNVLSHLDRVTADLESSVNITRIKKLLYFVVYGKWEVNEKKLTELKLKELMREIIGLNYNLEQLEGLLKDICSKINKQIDYLAVSGEIIQKIAPLYLNSSEILSTTGNSFNSDASQDNGLGSHQEKILTKYDVEDKKQVKQDLFEVRLKLVQRTNPLRVKILIFSAIHHVFTFSESDWLALKKYRLDELLEKLLRKCTRQKDLENQLYQTAKNFENKNENIQVASAIVKYLSPLYEKNASQLVQTQGSEQLTGSVTNYLPDIPAKENHESSNLVEFSHPEYEQAIASLNVLSNGSIPPETPIGSLASIGEFPHFETYHPGQVYASEDEITIPELHTSISDHFSGKRNFVGDFGEKNQGEELMLYAEANAPSFASKHTAKITEYLKLCLSLEEEINALVDIQVYRLGEEIENSLIKLENLLDDRLQGQAVFTASSLKYNSLKQMIVQIQEKTFKYLDLLSQMQQAEMPDLTPSYPTPCQPQIDDREANLADSADSHAAAEDKTIQLAKEGNAKAIAALMNQTLKDRGIHTFAAIKQDCLHIVLESEKEPNQKASINLVQKHLSPLEITSINKVKVHWRQTGSKSPVWSHEFTYIVDG